MIDRIESITYLMIWNIFYDALEVGCPLLRDHNVITMDYTTSIH